MTVVGEATTDLTTRLELDAAQNFSGMSVSSEASASIRVTNPNFEIRSYQAQSAAEVDVVCVRGGWEA